MTLEQAYDRIGEVVIYETHEIAAKCTIVAVKWAWGLQYKLEPVEGSELKWKSKWTSKEPIVLLRQSKEL